MEYDISEPWAETAAVIQARWDHGHDELTDDCALCQAEYAEVARWIREHSST